MALNFVCLKKMGPTFAEKHVKTIFSEVTPKKGLYDLCGRKSVGKTRTKTFRASLGKVGQKSFAPPKIACSYTYARSKVFDSGSGFRMISSNKNKVKNIVLFGNITCSTNYVTLNEDPNVRLHPLKFFGSDSSHPKLLGFRSPQHWLQHPQRCASNARGKSVTRRSDLYCEQYCRKYRKTLFYQTFRLSHN